MAVRLLLCFSSWVRGEALVEFVIILINDVVIGKSMLGLGYMT